MPNLPPAIDVLLPAYNGAAFIEAQIQSILAQDYAGLLRIHVRDDGSTDDTVAVVQQLQALALPAHRQLHLQQRIEGEGGVSHNISALLQSVQSEASYIALADQDDVWLPYKLRIQMEAMQQAEAAALANASVPQPVLICTDLTVVDAQLQPLHPSFWAVQKLDPKWAKHWQNLLVQNMVAGCTTLFNQAALAVILPIPTALGVFHDHWLATAVAYYGQLITLSEQTVLYRQHDDNVVGAQAFTVQHSWHKFKQLSIIIQRSQAMARALGHSTSRTALIWHKLRFGLQRLFL